MQGQFHKPAERLGAIATSRAKVAERLSRSELMHTYTHSSTSYMRCSVYMSGDMGRLDACFQQQGQAARYEELNSLQGFISWAC